MSTRRKFSAEFKAKVALESLVGDKTLAELSAKHGVHPNMIAAWKRHAKDSLPEAFSRKPLRDEAARDSEIKDLHAKIGELTIERDFLAKAFGR